MKILITGCAGFIGFHLSLKLSSQKNTVLHGIDNINNYYDIDLKKKRLKIIKDSNSNFIFNKIDICNLSQLKNYFKKNNFDIVVNLAAQAGVRNSITNPDDYFENNIKGFYNILELSRAYKIKHLIFASTSSVYGASNKFPLAESDNTDRPLSFYAATKKANEVMAYSYSNIYNLPCTALRFFTVYGPYGRPDMSLFLFTKNILESKKIYLFNKGKHVRDFTYIDDITNGIIKVINKTPKSKIPYSVYNLGSDSPHTLKKYLNVIESFTKKKARISLKPKQPGDVYKTHADVTEAKKNLGYKANTGLENGIKNFISWFNIYYRKK